MLDKSTYKTWQEIFQEALIRIEGKLDYLLTLNKENLNQSIEREYLSVYEVAKLFKVEQKTVYNWVSLNKIPHRKANGRLLFPRQEINEFILRNESQNIQ